MPSLNSPAGLVILNTLIWLALLFVLRVPRDLMRFTCRKRGGEGLLLATGYLLIAALLWGGFATACLLLDPNHAPVPAPTIEPGRYALLIEGALLVGTLIFSLISMPFAIRDIREQRRLAPAASRWVTDNFATLDVDGDGAITRDDLRHSKHPWANYLSNYMRDIGHVVSDTPDPVMSFRYQARNVVYGISLQDISTYPQRVDLLYRHW